MKNNKLKPCPFCGGNNIVIYDKSFNSGPYYDIFCRDCEASVRFADESETEEGAVNMWNTRIAPESEANVFDEKTVTQKYSNGIITLNAKMFPPITQETIDRKIRNFEPMKKAIEKLYEYEQKDIPMKIIIDEESGLSHCPNCGESKYILFGDKHCVECGQALDWTGVM